MALPLTKALQQACILRSQGGLQWCMHQSVRTTVVVARKYPCRLHTKEKRLPHFRPSLKLRDKVYTIEEVKHTKPAGNMSLILTVDVEGIGFRGDVVSVSKRIGRNHLLPTGAGIYTSQENLQKWNEIKQNESGGVTKSVWAQVTLRKLTSMHLPIGMNPNHQWTLNYTHVKVAFRKVGVEVPVSTITLPEELVTQPGEIKLQLTINGVDKVEVSASVYHLDPMEPDVVPPHLPPVWNHTTVPLTDAILTAMEKQRKDQHKRTRAG